MQVFIAGIMQGSRLDRYIDDQGYRQTITGLILEQYPEAQIVDPNELHPNGVDYDDDRARETLLAMADLAGQGDLVVAYVPRASMGTAIEMWEGWRRGVPVVSISPMDANWVVRYISDVVLPDMEAFRAWMAADKLEELIKAHEKPAFPAGAS